MPHRSTYRILIDGQPGPTLELEGDIVELTTEDAYQAQLAHDRPEIAAVRRLWTAPEIDTDVLEDATRNARPGVGP